MKYAFGGAFREAVAIRGLTARTLAEAAGVSPATAAAALHGRDIQIGSALRLARAVSETPIVPGLRDWKGGASELAEE